MGMEGVAKRSAGETTAASVGVADASARRETGGPAG